MATPEQYRNLAELSGGKVKPALYTDAAGETYNTDWLSEVTRSAAIAHNHNVAIVGSSRKFNYRASVNYKNAEGIARNTNRNEMIAKIAAGQKALDGWLDLQYDLSYMHYRNDYFCGDFKYASLLNPTYPIYDASTSNGYYFPTETGAVNPVENMNRKESYGDGNYFRGSVKATVNIKPVEGLKINAFGAMEEGDNRSFSYNHGVNTDLSDSGTAARGGNFNYSRLLEITADYVHNFNGHSLALVGGFSWQNFLYDGSDISNKGFPTDDAKYYQIGNGDATKQYLNVSSYRNSNTLAALFFRANYNYKDKYLLSASIRREGSSRFGANHKWGLFPALSAGWRVSGEDFMKNVSWVNDLKLRLGFGVTGNNLASDLRSIEMLSNGGTFWYNGQYVYTYAVAQNVNPDLKWEKKFEYNLGVDYSLLDNRLYGSLDVYYRHTADLLWDYEVPTPPYQFHTLLANAGQMDSYGAELSLSYVALKKEDFSWTTTPTISFNRNYITRLSDPEKGFNYKETTSGGVGENGIMNTNTQILIEGQPVGAFYGLDFAGFKSDGTWMFNTPEGGVVSGANATEGHRQVIGNAQPLFTFGWNNNVRYKNWDASLFFRGVFGNKILNLARLDTEAMISNNNQSEAVNYRWRKEGDITSIPRAMFGNGSNYNTLISDRFVEDGTFLRLNFLQLSYSFDPKKLKKWHMSTLSFYASANNLFCLTKYSGVDPEIGYGGYGVTTDGSQTPRSKSYTVGLTIGF
jgi:TonB-linked SusC/RagA family outer membrane protein